ncbi:hypothetical protein L6R50_06180 [Myxococcota bacterium]|nr:hypothetical protein [Myxococcota bacterium]
MAGSRVADALERDLDVMWSRVSAKAWPPPEAAEQAAYAAGDHALAAVVDWSAAERHPHVRGRLEEATAALGEEPADLSMAPGGLLRYGWATAYLARRGVVPAAPLLDEIDEAVLDVATRYGASLGSDDLVDMGTYLRERLPAPTAARALDVVLEGIERAAIPLGRGLGWPSLRNPLADEAGADPGATVLDAGLAHGFPRVTALLVGLCDEGIPVDALLHSSTTGMSDLAATGAPAPFYQDRGRGPEPIRPARIADGWCHGALGFGLTLLRGSRALGREDDAERAIELLRGWVSAAREPEDDPFASIGLCHGAAGRAQILARVAALCDDRCFASEAQRWRRVLADRLAAGRRDRDGGSFYQGIPGAALALATAAGADPSWDRLLLLS